MEAKCIICGSKLEHQQTDMAADIDPRYDGDHVAMIYKFRCPVCGRDYEVCDPLETNARRSTTGVMLNRHSFNSCSIRGNSCSKKTGRRASIPLLYSRPPRSVGGAQNMLSWRDDLRLPDQFPWPQPQALTRTIADVLDDDVPDTFFLRPESVISFLTRNEQGDRCLYRVSDHLPTPDEVRQWVRETTN